MRKLATIRKIDDIKKIHDANKLCVYVIDGWEIVDNIGKYNINDIVIMVEIDSWIPTEIAPFLTKPEHFPKVFNEVEGERLKTVKLRGVLSQGLILPLNVIGSYYDASDTHITVYFVDESSQCFRINDDISELLGIQKWEAPVNAQLDGICRGSFPIEVPKTDEERIQNLKKYISDWAFSGLELEVTEKLEGSSATFYLDLDNSFHVCSRNIDLKESDGNIFWKIARKYAIESGMRTLNLQGYAIQGEIIGEGIQKNYYNINGHDFYVFKIYNVKTGKFLKSDDRRYTCDNLWLKHVPIVKNKWMIPYDINQILKYAEGQSILNPTKKREGLVFNDDNISFKTINNEYLLKEK